MVEVAARSGGYLVPPIQGDRERVPPWQSVDPALNEYHRPAVRFSLEHVRSGERIDVEHSSSIASQLRRHSSRAPVAYGFG
jgi:hypothetical protein